MPGRLPERMPTRSGGEADLEQLWRLLVQRIEELARRTLGNAFSEFATGDHFLVGVDGNTVIWASETHQIRLGPTPSGSVGAPGTLVVQISAAEVTVKEDLFLERDLRVIGDITVDASVLFDGLNGALTATGLGLGTQSPKERLHVIGDIDGVAALFSQSDSGTHGIRIKLDTAAQIIGRLQHVNTAAATLRLDPISGGSSAARIELFRECNTSGSRVLNIYQGNGSGSQAAALNAATGDLFLAGSLDLGFLAGGNFRLLAASSGSADPTTAQLPNSGDLRIHTNTTTGRVYLAFNDGGTVKKVQLYSGNTLVVDPANSRVGINVSPSFDLDVFSASGNCIAMIRSTVANSNQDLRFKNDAQTWACRLSGDFGDEFWIFDATNNKVPFVVEPNAPSNMLRLGAAGFVGVKNSSPGEALDVTGNIKASGTVSAAGLRFVGRTSAAADPTTTQYPNSGDHGFHHNTASGLRYHVWNDGGTIFKTLMA